MTHLPYSTDFPKPGSILTAAQANALPVGSQIKAGDQIWTMADDGAWRQSSGTGPMLMKDGHTLIRVGPAAFAGGDVVTREQLDSLPVGAVVLPYECERYPNKVYTRVADGWKDHQGVLRYQSAKYFSSATFTIVSLPSTNPRPHGTLDWARWAAEHEGVCVRSEGGGAWIWKFQGAAWLAWSPEQDAWVFRGDGTRHDLTINTIRTGWSIVPDPSVAPVKTSDDRFAALTAQMVALRRERDNYATEQAVLAARVQQEKYRADMLSTERDAAIQRAEKAETDRALLSEELRRVSSAAQQQRDELQRSFDATFSDWQGSLAEVRRLRAELDAALARAEAAEARLVVPEDVK